MDNTLKSLSGSLKELNLKNILKTVLMIVFILLLVLCYSSYLSYSLKLSTYTSNIPSYHEFIPFGISILASIFSILLIFEITRNTAKSGFQLGDFLRFTFMYTIIYVLIIPVFMLSYLSVAYYSLPFSDRPTDYLDGIQFLIQNLSAIIMIYVFLNQFLFYAPFIQYIESRGFRYSLKKSISIFIKKPVSATTGIVVSHIIFIFSSLAFMLPFTDKMPQVISFIDHSIFIPVSLIPATIGMSIGMILMYSFTVKYYENRLTES